MMAVAKTKYGDMTIDELLAKKKYRKAVKGGRICWRTLFTNFVHQSFLYLDRTERYMRVLWEIVPTAIVCAILVKVTAWSLWIDIFASLVVVHFVNWVFNNNFWNCINCVFPRMRNKGTEATLSYLNAVRARLAGHSSITGIMLLGSLSRFQWHDRSDIDMRILRRPGFWAGIAAALLTSRERLIAVVERQPLDLYLADSPEFLTHHRVDETPIFTLWRDSRLSQKDFPGVEVPVLTVETFNIKT